jgi:hypothetical protein
MITLRHGIIEQEIIAAGGTPSPSYPTDGLVERWSFNETINGLNGINFSTFSGSPTYATGVRDKCLSLDGSFGLKILANSTIYDTWAGTNTWSLSYWVKTDEFTWFKRIISTNNSTYKGGIDVGSGHYSAPTQRTVNTLHYPGLWMDLIEPTFEMSSSNWYHIVFMRTSSTNLKVYINNSLDVNVTITSRNLATRDLYVGCDYSGSENFTGKIQLLYLYDKALSTNEISQLYNGGSGV